MQLAIDRDAQTLFGGTRDVRTPIRYLHSCKGGLRKPPFVHAERGDNQPTFQCVEIFSPKSKVCVCDRSDKVRFQVVVRPMGSNRIQIPHPISGEDLFLLSSGSGS